MTSPTKYDIIPIHTSDRSAFKYCRRQWGWSSPSRANLVPRTAVYGVYIPFWFGTGIHQSLERMYDPALKEDPEIAFTTWFDLQWRGGLVTESEVSQFVDRNPTRQLDGLYKVDGLEYVLPFDEEEKFMALKELGQGMMRFFKKWAEENDNFDVVSTEHDFSVPLLIPHTEDAFYAADNRRMPDYWEPDFSARNMYGPIMFQMSDGTILKQVHARGRMDMTIREREFGRYGIRDYKTASVLDDDYFRHLELDEQCTTYLWAGEIEAKMQDLPYTNLEFITYMGLFKGFPGPPTITSKGLPSINRKTESTTATYFEEAVRKLGILPIFERDARMQEYYTWLLQMGDKRYIWPKDVYRNEFQRRSAGIRIYYEALDMISPDTKLYPSPKKEYGCLNCRFRVPCIAAETGADYKSILEDGYVSNWDR